jgi:hypothetical protein
MGEDRRGGRSQLDGVLNLGTVPSRVIALTWG